MSIFRAIRRWWWARQRAADLQMLWPACKQLAPNVNHARVAFAVHAFRDPAWICEYGEAGLIDFIGELN